MRVSVSLSCVGSERARYRARPGPACARESGARTAAFLRNKSSVCRYIFNSPLNKLALLQSTHASHVDTPFPHSSLCHHRRSRQLLSLSFRPVGSIRNPRHVIATSISSFSRDRERFFAVGRAAGQHRRVEDLRSLMPTVSVPDLQVERCLSPWAATRRFTIRSTIVNFALRPAYCMPILSRVTRVHTICTDCLHQP